MLLLKTDKARQELAPGMRTLSLRERSLLLLAEGKPLAELQAMYSGGGAEIVEHLLSQGYLSLSAPAVQDTLPTTRPPLNQRPPEAKPPEPSDHLRSLAGARMYLFDICERLLPAATRHWRSIFTAPCAPPVTGTACCMWANRCWRKCRNWRAPSEPRPFASA